MKNGQPEFRTWTVDLQSAAAVAAFSLTRLQREVDEMAKHFPRWVLSVAKGRSLEACACGGVLVFDQGLRCVSCAKLCKKKDVRLSWFGLMPPIGIDSLPKVREAIARNPPGRHVLGHHPRIGNYILVPLIVTYPASYPGDSPHVFYLPELGAVQGVPSEQIGHSFHMLPEGRMCLYAGGEWSDASCVRETLQQRAYAHVVKLLNYANGKTSSFSKVS
jgi:hypothetical protein